MHVVFYLILFGSTGVLARYLLDQMITSTSGFPLSSFLINTAGSLLIGVIHVLGSERHAFSEDIQIAVVVGLLGGFTTFSTFSLQTLLLLENKDFLKATLYFLGGPSLGLLAAWLGASVTRSLMG